MSLSNHIKEFYSDNFDLYNTLMCDPQLLVSENAWVHVYAAHSTTDIRGEVLDDCNQHFATLQLNSMHKYYGENSHNATDIVEGFHYALFDSEWFRVKCIRCNYETCMAEVYFIDRGDFDEYPFAYLFDLFDFFYLFPPRAVKISIKGLEDYSDMEKVGNILAEMLVEKHVYINIKNLSTPPNDIFTLESEVYLMKQNGNMINVTSLLIDKIHESNLNPNFMIRSAEMMQYQSVSPHFAWVSCVKEKEIYIQLNSHGSEYFNKLMNSAKEVLGKMKNLEPIVDFDRAETYIVKDPMEGKLYRVKIINVKSFDEAEVMCIDFGKTFCVKKKDLVVLETISKPLAWFPEQAVQVNLYKISPEIFDKSMAAQLARLAPETQQVLFKVIDNTKEIPIVKLYMKEQDNCYRGINHKLLATSTKSSTTNS